MSCHRWPCLVVQWDCILVSLVQAVRTTGIGSGVLEKEARRLRWVERHGVPLELLLTGPVTNSHW